MSSPESLRGWDSQIRGWIRHPQAAGLTESACYKVFPREQAALAWRYRDPLVAEREDGTPGRPLVSRVLVGPTDALTPEVAIVACRAGPRPELVGPAPGQVTAGDELPLVAASQLAALARDRREAYDAEAARLEGLQAVVAAALSDPRLPLSVDIEEVLSQHPLADGVQGPLLWGLWRIAAPVFGSPGPDWSFSTFEPRLGDIDPGILPHVVFRVTDESAAAPARWRKEVRVRPFAPGALDAARPYAEWIELAGALVDEYRARGGDGFEEFIAGRCGAERSAAVRRTRLREALCDGRPPDLSRPAGRRTEDAAVEEGDPPRPRGRGVPPAALASPPSGSQAGSVPVASPSPDPALAPGPGRLPAKGEEEPAGPPPAASSSGPASARVSDLLRQLEVTVDTGEFWAVVQKIDLARGQVGRADRARGRKIVSNIYWYDNICRRFAGEFDIGTLARIFRVVVIPDVAERDVADVITKWAMDAPSDVIGGLLVAARQSGDGPHKAMLHILEPVLGRRRTAGPDQRSLWDPSLESRSESDTVGRRRESRARRWWLPVSWRVR